MHTTFGFVRSKALLILVLIAMVVVIFLSSVFPINKKIMVDYVVISKEVGDIGSLELLKKTTFFQKKVDISSLEDEEMVIF